MEDAKKAMDQNAEAVKKLNDQLVDYQNKFGDETVAVKTLYQDLLAKQANAVTAAGVAADKDNLSMPTIEELAGGHGWLTREKKLYGPAAFSNGPFAQMSRDLIHARNQEKWDIAHGNGEWTEKKDAQGNSYMALTGGAAYYDKQRATAAENSLSSAGFSTPEMRQKDMQDSLNVIADEIKGLKDLAAGKGINLNDDQ